MTWGINLLCWVVSPVSSIMMAHCVLPCTLQRTKAPHIKWLKTVSSMWRKTKQVNVVLFSYQVQSDHLMWLVAIIYQENGLFQHITCRCLRDKAFLEPLSSNKVTCPSFWRQGNSMAQWWLKNNNGCSDSRCTHRISFSSKYSSLSTSFSENMVPGHKFKPSVQTHSIMVTSSKFAYCILTCTLKD